MNDLHSLRGAGAMGLRHYQQCREALEDQLTGPIATMIGEQTGLCLHVLWHEPFDTRESVQSLQRCPRERFKSQAAGRVDAICRTCLEEDWSADGTPIGGEHQFVGPCGLTTFRMDIPTGGTASVLTLVLQAEVKNGDAVRCSGVVLFKFLQATALLRLLKCNFEMTLRALEAEAALKRFRHQIQARPKEHSLRRRQSKPAINPPAAAHESHAGRIAHQMISYVQQNFHRPMSLTQVADAIGMNAAYLSDLFSRHMGVTFHRYLVEIRMARARELLLEPHRRVCEVACAVGYASADQFRHAFKDHAGVPPSAWR